MGIVGRPALQGEDLGVADNALTDLYVQIRDEHYAEPVHCVLIDEAQFLTAKQVLQLTCICDRLDIPVLAYGIPATFAVSRSKAANICWPGRKI